MISKTRYVEGLTCPKILWLEINKPNIEKEEQSSTASEYGHAVGEIAKNYFGKHINIERTTNQDMTILTKEYLNNKNIVITEASFTYENLFCSVDILVKKDNIYELYEVKSKKSPTTKDMDHYLKDISFQYYILSKNGINVKKTYLMNINPNYIRKKEFNIKEAFILTDLTKEIVSLSKNIPNNISSLNNMLLKEEPKIELNNNCKDCPYFYYCTKHLPDNNVFQINSKLPFSKKLELYNKGIILKKEALKEILTPLVLQQLEHDTKDIPDYIDKSSINKFLKTLKEPLYYLDFETYSSAIPEYEGDICNEIIPFQYSLHYYDNNELKHSEFLGDGITDPRRPLAEQLIKDIPNNVIILAYHKSVECGIIKKLAERFPDLKEQLMRIHDNVRDLETPFTKRYFYTRNMNGRSSIKVVLPALCPELDYSKLNGVHKGDEATNAYLGLKYLSKEEQQIIREQLLTYCSLDTFAMVRILEELRKKDNI